jgi:hypothetical protein
VKNFLLVALLTLGSTVGSIVAGTTAFAQETSPSESALSFSSVEAGRALLACPQEAAAFAEKSQLMAITVVETSATEKTFKFEGKRLMPDGYRSLVITQKRGTSGDVRGVSYSPTLVR